MFFYLDETAEFSNYRLKSFINKYINSHLYQEVGLYLLSKKGKAILFRDSYKNNSWLKMLTLKISLIFFDVLM